MHVGGKTIDTTKCGVEYGIYVTTICTNPITNWLEPRSHLGLKTQFYETLSFFFLLHEILNHGWSHSGPRFFLESNE